MAIDQSNELPPRSRFTLFLVNAFYIALAVGLAALIQAFVIRPFIVSGDSMDPIIKNKEYLLIDEMSFRMREPHRGEVVVFRAPPEPSKYYIKRIIGLPGETVKIEGKKVTIINKEHPEGFVLDEAYIVHHDRGDTLTKTLPPDTYFMMGDNRDASYDSRSWGPLPEDAIRGRALLRLLPLSRINYLPGDHDYD